MTIPEITVGIMSAQTIRFALEGEYLLNGMSLTGVHQATYCDGHIEIDHQTFTEGRVQLCPAQYDACTFWLYGVTIGVNFHWQRQENQRFLGQLEFIIENGSLTAINRLRIEDYLTSVISSEMSASASLNLLKAHAVISRSWLLTQIRNRGKEKSPSSCICTSDETLKWYDRDEHANFDVCADDHCQRYQGITRTTNANVQRAIQETFGEVATYDGELCDTRFSKCCGGAFERFENCWQDESHPYLAPGLDSQSCDLPDLTDELTAVKFVGSSPKAYCNTKDISILSQVLNNYDQETMDFYRWTVEYTQDELSTIIRERTGDDYGKIKALVPIERGTSARLIRLKIVGEKQTKTIGKELEIRRSLSRTHLYSSAFFVETMGADAEGYPLKFILRGAGWGHGVGLCQIGAAVMGAQGIDYKNILHHYFSDIEITKLY